MSIRASGIVIKDQNLLVMKRQKNNDQYYTFPGGGIEKDETAKQAVIRELAEETMLECKVIREIYHTHYNNGNEDCFFLLKYLSGVPQLAPNSEEMAETLLGENTYQPQWLPVTDIPNTTLYPLEIRDLLITDLGSGFSDLVKSIHLKAI